MKLLILILFTNFSIAQNSIVSAGNTNETFGEVFPIMQTIQKPKEVSLSVPNFEPPIEAPKPIVKKKPLTWLQKLIKALFG
mgnify:CR=1 FL=1